MNEKETFYNDKNNCKVPFTHIEEKITHPSLKEIDEIYGAADVLSIENAKKHERNLWLLSAFGTIITILFLLYDEAEMHLLIFGCIIIIVGVYQFYKLAERNDCHRKSQISCHGSLKKAFLGLMRFYWNCRQKPVKRN